MRDIRIFSVRKLIGILLIDSSRSELIKEAMDTSALGKRFRVLRFFRNINRLILALAMIAMFIAPTLRSESLIGLVAAVLVGSFLLNLPLHFFAIKIARQLGDNDFEKEPRTGAEQWFLWLGR